MMARNSSSYNKITSDLGGTKVMPETRTRGLLFLRFLSEIREMSIKNMRQEDRRTNSYRYVVIKYRTISLL
jgi:hypothetical protein